MEFKNGNITMKCLNPEALPSLKKNYAKLIIKLAQKEIDKANKEAILNNK